MQYLLAINFMDNLINFFEYIFLKKSFMLFGLYLVWLTECDLTKYFIVMFSLFSIYLIVSHHHYHCRTTWGARQWKSFMRRNCITESLGRKLKIPISLVKLYAAQFYDSAMKYPTFYTLLLFYIQQQLVKGS